jgi:hypothetical protein
MAIAIPINILDREGQKKLRKIENKPLNFTVFRYLSLLLANG